MLGHYENNDYIEPKIHVEQKAFNLHASNHMNFIENPIIPIIGMQFNYATTHIHRLPQHVRGKPLSHFLECLMTIDIPDYLIRSNA